MSNKTIVTATDLTRALNTISNCQELQHQLARNAMRHFHGKPQPNDTRLAALAKDEMYVVVMAAILVVPVLEELLLVCWVDGEYEIDIECVARTYNTGVANAVYGAVELAGRIILFVEKTTGVEL